MPIRTEPMTVNVGPQHPSTHGVFRLRVTFDGEEILEVEPVFGYLHRGSEKLAEERNYVQVVTLTDRLDYVASMTNNQAYCIAVEKLLGIEPPPRAKHLRTITAELQRIASHLIAVGFFLQDLGTFVTPLMYCFRTRERILDMFEMLCGARITVSYMRPGARFLGRPSRVLVRSGCLPARLSIGVQRDRAPWCWGTKSSWLRTRGVSPLPADLAVNCSVSGPTLRASGLDWDWRKVDPYDAYGSVEFDVPVGSNGDNYDRLWVRLEEVHQSLRIVNQCVQQIEPGLIRLELPLVLRPEPGAEAYGRVESPRGELGFYLVSDGGISPYRCKIRSPSLINLTITEHLLVGWKLADMVVTLGSVDINMGEVDR